MNSGSAVTVLHVSDMQFGAKHRFGSDEGTAADRRHATLAARLLEDLRHLRDDYDLAPDLVVASGDLAEYALPVEFAQVHDFFAELCDGLGLMHDRVIMVPGNHDVNRRKCEGYFLDCEGDGIEPVLPYWPKLEPYATMFRRFYAGVEGAGFPKDQPWTIFEVAELKTVIAGLNSVMAESHRKEDHYGFCGEEQLRSVAARLQDRRREGWLRIGVVHHNPVITSGEDTAYLRDAGLFEQIVAPHLNLLMHGHTHEGRIHSIGPHGLPVLCAGSAGVRQSARADDVPNQYQLVRITADGLHVRARRYNPGRIRWEGDTSVGDGPEESHLDTNTPLREVDGAFPPEPADDDPQPGRDELDLSAKLAGGPGSHDPDDLLARVRRVHQVRHPSAQVDVVEAAAPRPLRYLRVTEPGEPQVSLYPIGVVAGVPTQDEVEDFRRTVDARYRPGDPALTSYLVYDGDPVPDDVRDWASMHGIRLQCLLEFQGLYDLRPYATQQAERLAASEIYPPDLYVPQRFTLISGAKRRNSDSAEVDALTRLMQLIADHDGRFVVVLGDFGHGKTFLLRELTRRIHQDQMPPVVPILIQLRELEKAHSLEQLLAAHLTAAGEEVIDHRLLRYLIREGRVLLLFDGFDELALRVTYDRAAEHLDALVRAAEGRAKVVLTSRTQHFLSDRQVETALSNRIAGVPGRTLMKLEEFTDAQILKFLTNLLDGDASAAQDRYELIHDIRDLLGLSRNPRMLSFIARLKHDRLVRARDRDPSGTISAATLYYELLDQWLGFEYERSQPPGAPPSLTKEERWATVTELALRLWDSGEESLGLEDLEEISARALRDLADRTLTADQASHLIGSGTLLVRTDEKRFRFVHLSVMEWLVANAATRYLSGTGEAGPLAVRPVSPLMADFVADLAGRQAAVTWCRTMLAADPAEVGTTAKSNALMLLRRLKESFHAASGPPVLRLAGIELSGADLTGADLHGANLDGADLSDTRLDDANLTGASLRRARMARCSGRGTRLTGADLTDADLSRARLLDCDLRDATLSGTQLTRTILTGATLDETAIGTAQAFGAALPSRPLSTVQFPAPRNDTAASITWHPDGQLLAYAGGGGVQIWDIVTGEHVRELAGASVRSVAWSPDGSRLAAGGQSGMRVWDAATGEQVRELAEMGDSAGSVWSVAWSPDGSQLTTGGKGGVRIWDAASGERVRELAGPDVRSVAWSPDGSRLAAGGDDGARIWDAASGERVRELGSADDPAGQVWSVAWSPDGTRLAAGSQGRVWIWEAATGQLVRQLAGAGASLRSVAWSPDGSRLTAGGQSGVWIWEVATGEQVCVLAGAGISLRSVAWSPDGSRLAAGVKDGVWIWDAVTGELIRELISRGEWSVAWSPDGSRLATGGEDGVSIWEAATGEQVRELAGAGGFLRPVAWSPDGSRLAAGVKDGVWIWDAVTGQLTSELVGMDDSAGSVWSVVWSPDGSRLASAGQKGARIWDAVTGELIGELDRPSLFMLSVAWSPDGSRLAVGDMARVRIWDVTDAETSSELAGMSDSIGFVWSVAWSPDGSQVAAGGLGGVCIWDAVTGEPMAKLGDSGREAMSVAWSPDSSRLAVDQHGISIWRPADDVMLGTLVPLDDGWAVVGADGFTYKYAGTPNGEFWWSVGLCTFAPGELDEYYPELKRLPAGTPLTEFAAVRS